MAIPQWRWRHQATSGIPGRSWRHQSRRLYQRQDQTQKGRVTQRDQIRDLEGLRNNQKGFNICFSDKEEGLRYAREVGRHQRWRRKMDQDNRAEDISVQQEMNEVSVFVKGWKRAVKKKEIWDYFEEIAKVANVYMPLRKDKKGDYFAFVRFNTVEEANRVIRARSGMAFGGGFLQINLARFASKPTGTNTKMEVNSSSEKPEVVHGEVNHNLKAAEDSLIWAVSHRKYGTEDIKQICRMESINWEKIWPKGEHNFLIQLAGKEEKEVVMGNKKNKLTKWDVFVFPYERRLKEKEAKWIEVRGLPVLGWSMITWANIASKWGEFIGVTRSTERMEDISKASIMVWADSGRGGPNKLNINLESILYEIDIVRMKEEEIFSFPEYDSRSEST